MTAGSNKNEYPSPGLIQNVSEGLAFEVSKKIIIIMVGLPARGKTFIACKIRRFLSWLGFKTKLFNIGNYRRKMKGIRKNASFFDPFNKVGVTHRTECAMMALKDLITFLRDDSGQIAIYDGTNSTKDRRNLVESEIKKHTANIPLKIIYIESICNDEKIIDRCIKEQKSRSPDYIGIPSEKAYIDFRNRISHYEKIYETIDNHKANYIKLYNMNKKVVSNLINGYLPSKILFFLTNLRIHKKPIFITRHGESEYNRQNRIGGDSPLSSKGEIYSKEILKFIKNQPEFNKNLSIWCSPLRRSIQTITHSGILEYKKVPIQWRALSEIESGICDGMTYEEIKQNMPEQYELRKKDKFNYRYPKGESYRDVILRLEPVIFELERSNEAILIIGHQAVLRCLYGYFCDIKEEEIPYLSIPLHTAIKLEQIAYGCDETRFEFNLELSQIREFKKEVKIINN